MQYPTTQKRLSSSSYKTASGNLAFHSSILDQIDLFVDSYKTASGNLAFHIQLYRSIKNFKFIVTKPQAVIWPFTEIGKETIDKIFSYKTASGNLAFHVVEFANYPAGLPKRYKTASGNLAFHRRKSGGRKSNCRRYKTASGNLAFHG